MDQKKVNEELQKFWNEAIQLPEDYKEEQKKRTDLDYRELAPAEKLTHAAEKLGSCKKVLDYGCGTGWAAITAAKAGCSNVEAVDLGQNIIDSAAFCIDLYGVKEQVNAHTVPVDWLKSVPTGTYDGLFCSNVLDVVPLETAKEILSEFERVTQKGATVILSLNFYMSPEMAASRNMKLVEGKYLFSNGVLRLSSLSDEEWKSLFEEHFAFEELQYFSWSGEAKESRRLFLLRKR